MVGDKKILVEIGKAADWPPFELSCDLGSQTPLPCGVIRVKRLS